MKNRRIAFPRHMPRRCNLFFVFLCCKNQVIVKKQGMKNNLVSLFSRKKTTAFAVCQPTTGTA